MKKATALFMSFMLVLSFAACSSEQGQNTISESSAESRSESVSEPSSESAAKAESLEDAEQTLSDDEANEAESNDGKTLVVYYSATGSTENVANYIAATAGADIFEIEPTEPYTDDDLNWTNNDSRVSREHEDESLRNVELVTTDVPNWEAYDTIFIGYPIWWGIAAWPVNSFVEANDFTGKTVIPFCTSVSSDLGESGNLLEELAGTGEWQEGERFNSSVSEDEVQTWVSELGL